MSNTNMGKSIIIDIDKIKEVISVGVRRSAVFMGLGLNAAYDEDYKKYELDNYTAIKFLPAVDDEVIKHFKEEFASWIIMNGLRELIETFMLFLDKIFNVCILVQNSKLDNNKLKKLNDKFIYGGIEIKLKILEEYFNINVNCVEHIFSIIKARNCYTHRKGIVGIEDCNDNVFELKWMGYDLFVKQKDGEIVSLDLPLKSTVTIRSEGTVNVKYAERKQLFQLGENLKLSPNQLAEICHFILLSSNEIISKTVHFFKSSGISVE